VSSVRMPKFTREFKMVFAINPCLARIEKGMVPS
jgi:hypothetical protein